MSTARTSGTPTTGLNETGPNGIARVAKGAMTGAMTFARRAALGVWVTLLASVASPVMSPAAAAEFETHFADDLNIVVVTGEIMPDDDELFLAHVESATANGEHALIVLSSDGGALGAGMHMGLVIQEAGLPTFVPEGERCASACALAWLAGAPRMTTAASEIGFHQPYDESTGTMVASIEANAVVGHYIATIGMGPEIVSFAVSAPPEEMAWLTVPVAATLGLDVVEIASEGSEAMAMLTNRTPPVDEYALAEPGTPLPIMRSLTPPEVASLSLTGAVDGTATLAGTDTDALPLVTAYTDEATYADEASPVGGPFEPLLDEPFAEADLREADLRMGDHSEPVDPLVDEMMDELTGGAMMPAGVPAAILSTDPFIEPLVPGEANMANVETAVMDALTSYGMGGQASLHETSAACWRHMRDEPSVRALQYCHVFDLVAAAVVDPATPGEFADFAIGVRLRAHREMVAGVPADYAAAWRDEAGLVVAALNAH